MAKIAQAAQRAFQITAVVVAAPFIRVLQISCCDHTGRLVVNTSLGRLAHDFDKHME